MDFLCLPTLREGFPNVVLEAGVAGVPTVTTTATGAIDSVIDGETGIIVTAGNARALATGIAKLAQDRTLRIRLGGAARAHIQSHFAQEGVWENLRSFYSTSNIRRSRRSLPKGIWGLK